jgi:hypothetical protein
LNADPGFRCAHPGYKLQLLGYCAEPGTGKASSRGIERLGAKPDGVLRSHQIANNGTLRSEMIPVETIFSTLA